LVHAAPLRLHLREYKLDRVGKPCHLTPGRIFGVLQGETDVDPRRRSLIASHIASTSRRSRAETGRLVTTLLHGSWPGGEGDRSEPVALEWVRRWRPARAAILPPACSCRDGYCTLCN
jgi:hypothetical protein